VGTAAQKVPPLNVVFIMFTHARKVMALCKAMINAIQPQGKCGASFA